MLLDVNVLFALSWDQHVHHEIAHDHFSGISEWSTCSTTEMGLVRLLLTPQVVGETITGAQALHQLNAIRSVPGWKFLADDTSLADSPISTSALVGRKQVTDLHLIGLAARHSTQLATFDATLRTILPKQEQHFVNVWGA